MALLFKMSTKNLGLNTVQDMNNSAFWALLVVAISLAFSAQVFLHWNGFYSVSADGCARTLDAYMWTLDEIPKGGFWLPFYEKNPWPPFHRVIVGLSLKLWPDLFITPRAVNFVFGILSLISLTWLSYELFKNRHITIVTAFLGSVFSHRVVLSLVPLAEIMFIFMVVTAMVFFARWLSSRRLLELIISSFFLAFSSTIRYEGWVFSGCLLLFVFVSSLFSKTKEKGRFIELITVIVILGSFPAYWIGSYAIHTGDSFGFVSNTVDRYQLRFGSSLITLVKFNVLVQFLKQNLDSFNLLGIVSLLYLLINDKRIGRWVVVPAVALLIMSGVSFFGKALPSHNFWRLSVVWSILLVPFTAHWVVMQRRSFLDSKRYSKYFVFLLFLLLFVSFVYQTHRMTENSFFSIYDRFSGEYVKERLETSSNAKILIETSNWHYFNVLIASQHPFSFICNSGCDPVQPEEPIIAKEKKIDRAELVDRGVRILIFETQEYKDLLNQDNSFVKIRDYGYWSIYELK